MITQRQRLIKRIAQFRKIPLAEAEECVVVDETEDKMAPSRFRLVKGQRIYETDPEELAEVAGAMFQLGPKTGVR